MSSEVSYVKTKDRNYFTVIIERSYRGAHLSLYTDDFSQRFLDFETVNPGKQQS